MESRLYSPENIILFKEQALQWACSFDITACYDSNGFEDPYSAFDLLIAAGAKHTLVSSADKAAFSKLNDFLSISEGWLPGFLSYDLKNSLEELRSDNSDRLDFPDLFFFVPEHLLILRNGRIEVLSDTPDLILEQIAALVPDTSPLSFEGELRSRFSREEYITTAELLRQHILRGDIYEVNFCQEFYVEQVSAAPLSLFHALNKRSPTPFSAFFKVGQQYILSASPERYLCRRDNKLISQPIKGTVKRSKDPKEDEALKQQLRDDPKEQAENVMIVDLVRNDLTKCSMPGTVRVEELFGIYTFKQVHQMVSRVVSQAETSASNAAIIAATFPMGSMTGAPKISAMELIERYERSKRGIFSGAVGYFGPGGDFDFNVIIRTLLYNADTGYLSFQVGSAITYAADAEKEYEECLLKAEAIMGVLGLR